VPVRNFSSTKRSAVRSRSQTILQMAVKLKIFVKSQR